MQKPDDERGKALHEAAHAVIAHRVGTRSGAIVEHLCLDEPHTGITWLSLPYRWRVSPEVAGEPKVMTCLAGLIAEGLPSQSSVNDLKSLAKAVFSTAVAHMEDETLPPNLDLTCVTEVALEAHAGDLPTSKRYVGRCTIRAVRKVLEYWGAIETVAAALIERRRLSGEHMCEIIGDRAEGNSGHSCGS